MLFTALRCIYCFYSSFHKLQTTRHGSSVVVHDKSSTDRGSATVYSEIPPRPDFSLDDTEPLQLRPFKPKYHMTMGIIECPLPELIEMDKDYISRVALRKRYMMEHPEITLQADPSIIPTVKELYIYLTSTYLPRRYPSMFRIKCNPVSSLSSCLENLVTGAEIPLTPPENPIETLKLLGSNIDEEFLLLTKDPGDDQYALNGYVLCFPSGFNTKEKFGMKLRDIHGPVPGYKEKLEKSMDRFFNRMETGRAVKRSNWSISTHERLFVPSGNHLYNGDEVEEQLVDISKVHLRCERQVLWRLPETRAIVFSFKTYMYPLQQIKDEGLGEDLAQAIDGLKEGSVPAIHFYKKGVVWGEAVKSFLRS
ncbi:hypothetical protein BJ878DRAFT_418693 [Calycina marina]|uniref:Uncharacterized protein n=1 Tax=Calycina marina TaxID=1763456 RepID=A0A9P7Z4X3_9HELO|nr:hypothetical protein BJ878DRAFT_418693 [Calycina marina]